MAKKAAVQKKPCTVVMKSTLKKVPSSGSKSKGLSKKDLDKVPKAVSLNDKVKNALATAETPEEAASNVRSQLSKLDKSVVWSRYQTHLKHNPAEKELYDQKSNLEKGNAQALWFITQSAPKFMGMRIEVGGKDKVTKKDEWCSHQQMVDKFGETDMQLHVTSGRLLWRECPLTRGVWEYKDQGAVSRKITLEKGKTLKTEQECEPNEDQDKAFKSLYDADLLGMLGMSDAIFQTDGVNLTLVKGKGKGQAKGKGKEPPPAPDPEARTDEEQLEDAKKKCKKMRDVCNKALNDLLVLIKECKGTKFWSKAAQAEADTFVKALKETGEELQAELLKKSKTFEKLKEVCLKAAVSVKSVMVQMKEYRGLMNKTSSKASNKNK